MGLKGKCRRGQERKVGKGKEGEERSMKVSKSSGSGNVQRR